MIMFYQQGSLVVNDKQLPLMDSGWLEDEQGGGLHHKRLSNLQVKC
jgi:hypothetical protein